MSAEIRALLTEVAPRPTRRLDAMSIQRRGNRIRLVRRALAAALALPLLGGLAWAADSHWLGRPSSIAPAGDADPVYSSPCEAASSDITVFLKDGASVSGIVDLEFQVRKVSHVKSVVYVSKPDAFAEFKAIYQDQPKYWRHLPVDALPASLRVDVDEPFYIHYVVDAIPTPPVIDEISTRKPHGPCSKKDSR